MLTLDAWQFALIMLGLWLCGPLNLWAAVAMFVRWRRRRAVALAQFEALKANLDDDFRHGCDKVQDELLKGAGEDLGPLLETMHPHYKKFAEDYNRITKGDKFSA